MRIKKKKNPIHHAYYHEYRLLQSLCLMILKEEKHQIGSGTQRIQGILFDCAWLWEEYMDILVGDLFYHPKNKGCEGAQQLFSTNSRKLGLIYPDFIGRTEKAIADAKYKPIENIRNKDYLQILAYMFRFNTDRGFYFYPEIEMTNHQILRINSGSTYERNVKPREKGSVIKVGLKIPQDSNSYDEFVSSISISERNFINYLHGKMY